ncbi:E3 ubiquitin-protein ligase TRIM71-like [Branchiostoma floridae]|uniref:E3 ubiquitin-protein ligase TRIM71-like n=1 Tax=Branchiostoma floridae TaxID=7739 RepID=A0A9J7HGT6_BRAFL|nr:E3 ubiquitin-protein ligase TRIM71-like [Branchiostoma floridae]
MGSPVSPVLANLFMEWLEQQAMATAPVNCRPKLWKRYVDDIMEIIRQGTQHEITDHLNSIDPTGSIKFTHEEEDQGTLPFLDTLLVRREDGTVKLLVYRKKTHTDQYLDFNSHHPLHQKLGVIRTLMDRSKTVVTEETDRQQEVKHIKQALSLCGYPDWTFKRVQHQSNKPKPKKEKKKEEQKSKGMIIIPYVKGITETLERIFRKHAIATAVKPKTTLRNLLVHPKDRLEDSSKTDCVYKIPCKSCDKVYIGETGRTFNTRLEEHKKEAKNSKGSAYTRSQKKAAEQTENKSAVTDHIHRNNCVIDWEGARVIDREENRRTRWIKEAVWIRKSVPVMNRDEGGYKLSLPDNLMAANMCERLQNQATLSGEISEQPQSGNRCSFHPSEEVKLYCKQCNMPVCSDCCEDGHDGHPNTGIKKAAQERRSTVQALINEGRDIVEIYGSFIRGLEEKEKTLNKQKQQRDDSIIQTYDQMVQKLTERKDQLLSESWQNYSENLEKILTNRDRVLPDVNKLSAACDRAEQELQQGLFKFLSQEIALTELVGKYRGKAAPTPVQTQPAFFQPTDTTVPVLGHVMAQSVPSAPIPPSLALIPAAPAPIPAVSSDDAVRGRGHRLLNQKEGEHHHQRVTFGGEGSENGQFDGPRGVTVSDEGEIFVADTERCKHSSLRSYGRIQVFTMHGTFVRQFSTPPPFPFRHKYTYDPFFSEQYYPNDVTVDGEGNLWVVGRTCTHREESAVQYSKQGKKLRAFRLQKECEAVSVDTRRNHILITQIKDSRSNVQVFEPDGTLLRTVGDKSRNILLKEIVLIYPVSVTLDGERNILVSDSSNHRIHVFKNNGRFLFQFGGKGSSEGQLLDPHGICTDRAGNIIVADYGNSRVEMFDKTGKFLKHIVTDIKCPWAVAMAPQGQLVVTVWQEYGYDDFNNNHTVSIFHNY